MSGLAWPNRLPLYTRKTSRDLYFVEDKSGRIFVTSFSPIVKLNTLFLKLLFPFKD